MFRSSSSLCEQARQIARCQVAVLFCLVINWSSVFDDDNDNHCIREKGSVGNRRLTCSVTFVVRRARLVSTFLVYVWRLVQRWKDYDWSLDEGCSSIDIADLFQFSPRIDVILPFTVRESFGGMYSTKCVRSELRPAMDKQNETDQCQCVKFINDLAIVDPMKSTHQWTRGNETRRKMKNSFLIFVLFEWPSHFSHVKHALTARRSFLLSVMIR